jgi:hypothetical protein
MGSGQVVFKPGTDMGKISEQIAAWPGATTADLVLTLSNP